MKLNIETKIQIQRPIGEVFEAIVNPDKMSRYFIAEGSGRLEEGMEVIWCFPEFPEERFPVRDIKIIPNRSVSFVWDPDTVVRINLEEQSDKSVLVQVSEGEKDLNDDNLKWFAGNTGGWANFLACLKAFVEYGINLRKGAFEFMRPK